jgi:peptide/nickel transport system permease protein
MPFIPVILTTDALLYVLIGAIVLYVWYARQHEHLSAPWRVVARSKTAMGSLVIMLFYLLVALADSVHFRALNGHNDQGEPIYATQVQSLLDVVLEPIHRQREKTYSAPFATHLYSKETIELDDGRQIRDFPRLKYGGAHLADPQQDKAMDIAGRLVLGICYGLLAFSVVMLLLFRLRWPALFDWWKNAEAGPQHTAAVMLALLLMLVGLVITLGQAYHILGTDKVGEDVLYQAVKSIRTGLLIGTLTTLVMLPAAILLGTMAGYFRGWIDDVIQYVYTTLSSVPGVLLIAAAVLMMDVYMSQHQEQFNSLLERADFRLLFLCLILGITSWTSLCRLLRGETLKLRQLDYVQAAQAFGVSHFKILWRHILPNVMHIVLIVIVLDFSGLVLAEAVLSYINIGVDPNTDSWGNMINSARLELAREPVVWWSLLAAFAFMFVLVLAANLLADAVRDAFDPRLRERHDNA